MIGTLLLISEHSGRPQTNEGACPLSFPLFLPPTPIGAIRYIYIPMCISIYICYCRYSMRLRGELSDRRFSCLLGSPFPSTSSSYLRLRPIRLDNILLIPKLYNLVSFINFYSNALCVFHSDGETRGREELTPSISSSSTSAPSSALHFWPSAGEFHYIYLYIIIIYKKNILYAFVT